MNTAKLAGLRVMVVEDEALVAMLTCDTLEDLGCQVLGPFATAEKALGSLQSNPVDMAVLDVNLGDGQTSGPVASALAAASTPFLFTTGYGSSSMLGEFPQAPIVTKPFTETQLEKALNDLIAMQRSAA